MTAAYTIYELLDVIIDQIPWRSEAERMTAHASVAEFRNVNLFGQMAVIIECDHNHNDRTPDGKCTGCGRQVGPVSWRG